MMRILALLVGLLPAAAMAQVQPKQFYTPDGYSIPGTAGMCNPSGASTPVWVACTGAGGGGSSTTVVTATSRGGTITTGGADQTIAAANASRHALVIQNPCSATESLFVNINAAASTTGSGNALEIAACGIATLSVAPGLIDQEAVHITAATTGHAFYAKEY